MSPTESNEPRNRLALAFCIAMATTARVSLANICLGVIMLVWAVSWLRGRVLIPSTTLGAAVAGWFGATLLSIAFSQDPSTSLGGLAGQSALLLVPIALSLLDRRSWPWLVGTVAAMTGASSAVALAQYFGGARGLDERISGLHNYYMTFSGWVLAGVLLLGGELLFHPDRRRRWWVPAVMLLGSLALALSYTRNAWVGLAVGAVLAAALWRPKIIIAYPFVALVLWALLPSAVGQRAKSIVDLSQHANHDRLRMYASGIDMVIDHPVFGIGLEMVSKRYPLYRRDDAPSWRVPHLHSNLLQIAAERGLVGLAAYLVLLAVFLRHAFWAFSRSKGETKAAVAGCLIAIVGLSAAGLFEYNWGDSEIWMLTLVLIAAPFALVPESRR